MPQPTGEHRPIILANHHILAEKIQSLFARIPDGTDELVAVRLNRRAAYDSLLAIAVVRTLGRRLRWVRWARRGERDRCAALLQWQATAVGCPRINKK